MQARYKMKKFFEMSLDKYAKKYHKGKPCI